MNSSYNTYSWLSSNVSSTFYFLQKKLPQKPPQTTKFLQRYKKRILKKYLKNLMKTQLPLLTWANVSVLRFWLRSFHNLWSTGAPLGINWKQLAIWQSPGPQLSPPLLTCRHCHTCTTFKSSFKRKAMETRLWFRTKRKPGSTVWLVRYYSWLYWWDLETKITPLLSLPYFFVSGIIPHEPTRRVLGPSLRSSQISWNKTANYRHRMLRENPQRVSPPLSARFPPRVLHRRSWVRAVNLHNLIHCYSVV